MEKLRAAYFSSTTSVESIKSANIALMSDLTFTDSILKAVILQAGVNTNGPVKSQYKNTFIFRLGRLLHNQKKNKVGVGA